MKVRQLLTSISDHVFNPRNILRKNQHMKSI